mmetsp:Transcript_91888/g.230977  ORF Transcript_91888/g.230977 Transcript_91888/m.230977 type:complete len:491 (+) Transcript_91888:93-1565(+)
MTSTVPKPKVQRTYSDPDLPELLQLPVRPASSYEPRPKPKEHPQFTHEAVEAMAKKLGLDIEEHPDFQWLVRDCLLALRDENFTVQVRGEDVEYVYKYTDEARSYHPIVEAHRKMAEGLLMVQESLKMKRLDPQYRVKHLVYLAIMGEKDARGVTNEKLVEEVMELLDVNPLDEPYLVPRIKVSIEDCYFRMKEIGPENITIDNCIDVESLIVNLELDRIGFLKKISPSGLLYCVENQTQLADVISTGSHDVLCYSSAVEVHSTGKRQDMPLVFFEQVVCAECEVKAADIRDQDDMENYCYDCFKATHARGKRQRHCVSLPYRTFCAQFPEHEASYICFETSEVLSTKAVARMRKSAARQNFTLFGLRKAAYSKKLFANNLDRLMNILQNHIDRQYPLSPWFIFYDKALAPYWYNFQTHEKEPADPNNLIEPPLPQGEDDNNMEGTDEQYLSNAAGAGNLRDTHAARFAAQGAVFDVPPPVHVKFALPMK